MTNKELADLLLPNVSSDISIYEEKYPERDLDKNSMVVRFAPSPTGFVHMGSLFTSFICRKVATDTKGVFFLRVEDTDQKRQVENGIKGIVEDLKNFKIDIDEGPINEEEEKGEYGSYIQSKRKDIYQSYVKYLLQEGKAYPCFCTSEDIENTRELQEKRKQRIGYYGRFTKCRKLTSEEISEKVKQGEPYIIRLKSLGDFDNKIKVSDLIKGELEFPENDLDVVILKSDGLPTYHFAHLVDDHLMRTTHVIRGDEWLSSLPLHVQLFQAFNFNLPKYAHVSPIMKEEDGSRRKLSKRKDPEAAVSYYHERGIPVESVKLYLMTLANSNFEQWYDGNKDKELEDFTFDFKKMSSSGGLFDVEKLMNISKNYISRLSATTVYDGTYRWAKEFDSEFAEILEKNKEYAISVLNIEREQKKPRKDYGCYSEIKDQSWYMFDELFEKEKKEYLFQTISDKEEINNILSKYIEKYYSSTDTKEEWFDKLKLLADDFGYAKEVRDYKENPDRYKGHVGDISLVLRIALTTKSMTPDLYDIMIILGKDKIVKRYNDFIKGI
jgi:glutamyl-tRNA synthetase, bacterial family